MSRIEAVVFDMDGVLLDSEPFWQEAEIEAFGSAGLSLDRADCRRTMGMRVDEVVAFWMQQRPAALADADGGRLVTAILGGVIARIRAGGSFLPGVTEALETVRRRGYRMALASSSPTPVIEAVVATLGLGGVFEHLISAEDEARGKPDPAVYLTTCRRLAVAPQSAVAIEDSLAGLAAARAAGMRCVMAPDRSLRGRGELESADRVVKSLADLDERAWDALEAAAYDTAP